MKKVLLLPGYLGGGFGHIGRCLALAAEFRGRGWEAAFALGGQHVPRVMEAGFRVFHLHRPFEPQPGVKDGPAFTIFSDFSYQLVRDGLNSPNIIRACLSEQLQALRSFGPDLLVSDSWPLAGILGHLAGIPVVQIVRQATHPDSSQLMWWQDPPAELHPPDPRPLFNPILERLGLPLMERAADLLRGDLYLVPSIPELEPVAQAGETTHYVGPLTRASLQGQAVPEWLEEFTGEQPLVYITLGGGAGPVGGPAFYRMLFCALDELPARVVASTGQRFSPADLPPPPDNFRLEAWVPGPAVIARSALVVYPGGYGTSMELVQSGVPGLVLPFHSEQESNGRRLEASGAARVLLPSDEPPEVISGSWAGNAYTFQVHPFSSLTSPIIHEAISSTLIDPGYRRGARRVQDLAARFGGPAQAVSLMEELVGQSTGSSSGWDRLTWWERLSLSPLLQTR
jgi:UDP:flavonoid glycosyltransferase YjiC (YdhE family)